MLPARMPSLAVLPSCIDIVAGADARVIQDGSSLGFTLESLPRVMVSGQLFRQGLQGDGAFQLGVFSFAEDPQTSAAKLLKDLVVGNRLADHGESLCLQFAHCNEEHPNGVSLRSVDAVLRS
jgi:hypothetical protein